MLSDRAFYLGKEAWLIRCFSARVRDERRSLETNQCDCGPPLPGQYWLPATVEQPAPFVSPAGSSEVCRRRRQILIKVAAAAAVAAVAAEEDETAAGLVKSQKGSGRNSV